MDEFKTIKDLRKRKGVIEFSPELLDLMELKDMKLLFSNFYVFNIMPEPYIRTSYYGFSEHFREVEEGTVIPHYIVTIDTIKNIITFDEV